MTMRITTTQLIAGQPAPRVRQLMRAIGHRAWYVRGIADFFEITDSTARRLIRQLVREGYLERAEREWDKQPAWGLTDLGVSLAKATAARPITRARADQLLREVAARMAAVEAEPFAFRVSRGFVFGSYLDPLAERLGDLDVAVELLPRILDPDARWKFKEGRIRLAQHEGRRFGNISEMYDWPWREVMLFLRARRRALSLLDVGEKENRAFLVGVPHRQIFPPVGDGERPIHGLEAPCDCEARE